MKIDWWTLGLEAVNVAVLVWLLARFFWRPVAAMIAQRRLAAAQELSEAAAKHAEAEKTLAEVAAIREGLAKEREALLVAAAAEADKERAARLEKATQEIEVLRAAAEVSATKLREAAAKTWRDRAGTLAIVIAARLLKPLDGAAVRQFFVDGLVHEINNLGEPQRQGLASAELELVSASPLTPDEQERCRSRLSAALGTQPQLAFAVDPTEIAGLLLRGPNLVVSNSWRGDLDRIRAELGNDG